MRWYCVYTQPQLERWARTNLWERGFEVYLPEYRRLRRHARRVDRVERPLFPRYLFVLADLASGARRAIRTARGVIDLVAFGSDPPAVPDPVIAEIKSREGPDGMVVLGEIARLNKGDPVRVIDGPLADQVGMFESANDERRVIVLLHLLGGPVRATMAAAAIERVT